MLFPIIYRLHNGLNFYLDFTILLSFYLNCKGGEENKD